MDANSIVRQIAASSPGGPCRSFHLPTDAWKAFFDGSEKAAAQWKLERRFRAFENKF
jgi:hypothetical protein